MNKINTNIKLLAITAVFLVVSLVSLVAVYAATTPSLGTAGNFGVLASTFQHNGGLTTITGSVGYVGEAGTGTLSISGATEVNNATRTTAGTDQGTALSALASQTCTFNYGSDTDLSLLPQPLAPGVYCVTGAASVGTGGITLSGAGTYIFRITGALTTVNNSQVTMANGASSCDVFWTPTSATTLGANTTFVGTIISDAGITIGSTTTLNGRALAFGGTVTTDTDTITSTCTTSVLNPSVSRRVGTINVVKVVINDNGGIKTISDFPLFVNGAPVLSGITNDFQAPASAYTISETSSANYAQSFSGDCDINGQLNLNPGDNRFCIITNNDIGKAVVVPLVPPLIEVIKTASPLSLPLGPGPVTYTYTLRNMGTIPVTNITMVGDTCSPIVLASGDANGDNKLDVNETWIHTCSKTLTETHTNNVVATGWANGISTVDIASATVVVGAPVVPPLIHITKVPSVFTLSAPGGVVTYSYTVTNPGTVPLSDIILSDDKCTGLPSRVVGHPGDINKNNLLESSESWSFTCRSNLTQTTINTGSVQGSANGLIARDFALATVVVSAPKLPSAGIGPSRIGIMAGIAVLAGALILLTPVALIRKRFIVIK